MIDSNILQPEGLVSTVVEECLRREDDETLQKYHRFVSNPSVTLGVHATDTDTVRGDVDTLKIVNRQLLERLLKRSTNESFETA